MLSNDLILAGLISHSSEVVRDIYITCFPSISRWITLNSGSEDDVDDVFQEAMLIIYRKISAEGIILKCNFKTYLFSICKHLWYQELRRRSKLLTCDTEKAEYLNLEDDFKREERLYKVYLEYVNRLETKCKQLLLLCSEGKSNSEIKEIMGFPNNQAVADKKKNCKKKLIEALLGNIEYRQLIDEIHCNH